MGLDFKKDRIFVEGIGDRPFISAVLLKLGYPELSDLEKKEMIIYCDGYESLGNFVVKLREINKDDKRESGRNLVIFDADFEESGNDNHGFKNKLTYLEGIKEKLNVEFDIFLFPNDRANGTLETILESCIPAENSKILECWKELEACVSKLGKTVPANKSKIYFYLETLHGTTKSEKKKIKDPVRDFTTKNWIFDFENNENLIALKNFLGGFKK